MKGLVLAGGNGTRLWPLTHTGPKQLIPIANKPNILYCLEDLREAGITDIGIILGNNMPEKVRELLRDGKEYGVKITYIEQGYPKGIAHAVGCAEEFTGDHSFVVYLGDNILNGGIRCMVEEFHKSKAEALVALTPVDDPAKFGIAELNDKGDIIGLVEKPIHSKSNLAVIGVYFFRPSVFAIIRKLKPSLRNELEIIDAIDGLRRERGHVVAYQVKGWWKDTGRPEDIIHANRLVLENIEANNRGKVEDGAQVIGRVIIGDGTRVMKGSVIQGPSIIGDGCTIGPGTNIGPYTSIGDHCHIIGGSLESSIVISNTEIDCGKRIMDSLIGGRCRISSSEDRGGQTVRLILGENSQLTL